MAEKIITTKAVLDSPDERCPRCKNKYTAVEYYTADYDGRAQERTGNTIRTYTLYKNITPHTGGLCRHCNRDKVKRVLPVLFGISFVGVAALFVDILIIVGAIPIDRIKFGGLEIILGLAGLFVFLVFSLTAVRLWKHSAPQAPINDIALCNTFIDRLREDGNCDPNYEYLSPETVKQLYSVKIKR